MATIGREIENAIQSIMTISEEYAHLQAKLDQASNDVNVLETLLQVSKYIGSDSELTTVLNVLEDSVKGVFGASQCQVIFPDNGELSATEGGLANKLSFTTLQAQVEDYCYLTTLDQSELTELTDGQLLVIKLNVGAEVYGFLVIYWAQSYNLSHSSLVFLRIISNQVSIYLKNTKLVKQFQNLAEIDPLTGVYNRSYFSNIESSSHPITGESILMFDLDRFKGINDKFGHQYGDKILKQFADILIDVAAESDSNVFRYGGEEFVLRCYGGQAKAMSLAETIRQRFEEKTSFTVSIGITTCGEICRIADYNHLIETADEALYLSKEAGRNRATLTSADIQIIKKIMPRISRVISHGYRQGIEQQIYRLKVAKARLINLQEYEKLRQLLLKMIRMHDEMIITSSLDAMIIIDGKIDPKNFSARICNVLNSEFAAVSYQVIDLNDQLLSQIARNKKLMTMLSEFFSVQQLDREALIDLKFLAQWHGMATILIDEVPPQVRALQLFNHYLTSIKPAVGKQLDQLYQIEQLDSHEARNKILNKSSRALCAYWLVTSYLTYLHADKRRKLGSASLKTFISHYQLDQLALSEPFSAFIESYKTRDSASDASDIRRTH